MKKLLVLLAAFFSFSLMAQQSEPAGNINRRFDYNSPCSFKELVQLPGLKNPSLFPNTNLTGSIAYDVATKKLFVYNGIGWVAPWEGSVITTVTASTGLVKSGTGDVTLSIDPAYTTARNTYADNAISTAIAALTLDGLADTSGRKAIANGTAPATASAGKISYASGFNFAPNTSSQSTWNPGFFVSDGTRNIPLLPNARLQPTGVKWIGDSFTANYGLSSANDGFVNKVSNLMGWNYTNGGISGSTITGHWKGLAASSSEIVIIGIGQNDCRQYGLTAVSAYQNMIMGYMLSYYTPITAQSFTKTTPADWSATNIYFNTTTGSKTSVNNSPATFTTTGSTIYVNVAYEVSGDATYTITIDGVNQGTFTAVSTALAGYPAPTAGSDDTNYYPFTHRFSGLARGTHTVSIQRTGGTKPLRLISALSNESLKRPWGNGGLSIYFWGPTYQAAGSTYSGNISGLNDAMFDAYNEAANATCSQLALDGMQVKYIDVRPFYNPNKSGSVQADLLHPSAQGCTELASAFITNLAVFNHKDEQLLNYLMQSLKGNANYIPKYSGTTVTPSAIYETGGFVGINNNTPDSAVTIGPYNTPSNNRVRFFTALDKSEFSDLYYNGSSFLLQTAKTGAGIQRPIRIDGGNIEFQSFGSTAMSILTDRINITRPFFNTTTYTGSTGTFYGMANFTPTINLSGSATSEGIYYYPTITGTGSGGTRAVNIGKVVSGTTTTTLTHDLITGNTVTAGSETAAQFRLSALNTAPASSTDTGTTGEIRITANYIYVCIATNTWVRSALTTF